MHINIRSLHKNFDSLTKYLNFLCFQPDVICLTETRIKTQPLLNISIPGYSFVHNGTPFNAEGVAACISNKLEHNFLPTRYPLNNADYLWLEISEHHSISKYRLTIVYRHSHQSCLDAFIKDFSACLLNLTSSNKPFYISGNYNINISKPNQSPSTTKHLNHLLSCGAFAVIQNPLE